MLELFANPGFLVAGGAAVSAPIIIHLINRMRFKRLRWAAMEFLLKAQKRSRRRLIIEQLLLLLLRCLLVALVGLLVARFLGWSLADVFSNQTENVHVVILDDTLSLRDKHKDEQGERNAFAIAKKDVLVDTILKNVSQSQTNDRVAIIPLSRVATEPDFKPKVFERLNVQTSHADAVKEVLALEPSKAHVDMARAVDVAGYFIGGLGEKKVTVHIVSDFRKRDWVGLEARPLHEILAKLAKLKLGENQVKVRLVDAAFPLRVEGQAGAPNHHDNIGIVDFRATTKVTGKGMPVTFLVTIANFSPRDADVGVKVYDDSINQPIFQIAVNNNQPVKVPANETATVSFEHTFHNDVPDGKAFFAAMSARLEGAGALETDSIAEDNVRHIAVEVRNKVPVLVIDGRDVKGLDTNGDSFFVDHALASIQGSSYEVVHASRIAGGDARSILDSPDLSQYPTMLLLNVPELTDAQVKNLEKYVKQGGGVGFFLGPLVNSVHYNEKLWKKGKGVFPVPLEDKFHPPAGQPELPAEFEKDRYQLLLRDDNFPGKDEKVPIFGAIFKEAKLRDFLKHLPVKRYYPAGPTSEWNNDDVKEIANLPNDKSSKVFAQEANAIVSAFPFDRDEFKDYFPGLRKHQEKILRSVTELAKMRAYQFAEVLNEVLTDRGGGDMPNMTELWKNPDPKISTLREKIVEVRKAALYSHPLILTSRFGEGRVVAVMTTAGKEWNDWAGGITGSVMFPPMIWEMQNYLSSSAGEAGLTVGTPLVTAVDSKRFGDKKLVVTRTLHRPPEKGQKPETVLESNQVPDAARGGAVVIINDPKAAVKVNGQDGKAEVKVEVKVNGKPAAPAFPPGTVVFTYHKTLEPGLYVTELRVDGGNEGAAPLQTWGQVVNVDTKREGRLQRAELEQLDSAFLREAPDMKINAPGSEDTKEFINKQSDLSEWPWLFLIFLAILVCEQALAVHLSFHLKGNEAELPSQVVKPHA